MASDKDASCANDPDFAVICAFLEKFADKLQVDYPDFKQLQDWLMNTDQVPNGLRDLHIKLMRKTRKTVHECAWETALSKFCFSYSSQDGWEIERFGYKKSSLKVKLRILRELLESQFDRNNKFRAKILTMSADSLRSQPIGRDRLGHAYWLTQDLDCNIRIYQEHLDEDIWQVVATNREELVKLISRLKGNEVVLPSEIGIVDEDSSSNSCSVPVIKQPPPEEKDDSQESNHSVEGRIPNIKIKLGNKENGVVVKSETLNNGSDVKEEEEKKVKPLVISHSKIAMEKCRKRMYEESERPEPEQIKKQRPTLLDSKREKKLSKYEKAEQEDEEDDEDSDDEGEEEEEGDEDSGAEGEEEDDEGEEEAEDEGVDVEEEDADDDDEEDEAQEGSSVVGEAVEDPPLLVKGEGSGEECESCFLYHLPSDVFDRKPEFSEIIEETTLFVVGEGTGAECLVGNAKTSESEPKATFFFGQPGCLKLSPLKNQAKSDESLNCQGEEKKPAEPSNGETHPELTEEPPKTEQPREESPDLTKSEQKISSPEERRPPKSNVVNRKRRLSVEKPERQARHSSESETDLNSEILDTQVLDLEDDIEEDHGGKRPKMRSKILKSEIRKKVEVQRNNATIEETTSSSGEDEKPRKKIVPRKIEKEMEKKLPLKAKFKQAVTHQELSSPVEEGMKPDEIEKTLPIDQMPQSPQGEVKAEIPIKDSEAEKAAETPCEPVKEENHLPETASTPSPAKLEPEPLTTSQTQDNLPPESKEAKPEPPPDDHTTIENQRKRRSSEDEPKIEESPAPPPVPVKTRFSRRGGPPEPVIELPLPKRTRVKANQPSTNHSAPDQVKKEIPDKVPNAKPKGKAAATKSAPIKQEDIKPKSEPASTDVIATEEATVKAEIKPEDESKPVPITPKPVSTARPRQQAAQKQPATAQRRKHHDAIDTSNIIDTESEIAPVRQSRRIAQLKIREEAERRKMEEIALRNMKAELKKKKKAEKVDDPTVSEPSEHSSDHADSEVEIKKKAEKKKKCPGKGGWSSGSEEPEEEEEDQYETDPGSPLFKSDHEFSPESELEDETALVPLKRARTARKEGDEIVETALADESCQKCGKSDHPEWILLCDKCDKGYHCSCLSPVLFYIPEGDWFCPPCQQKELIAALENHLKQFDDLVQRKKEEEEEKLRLERQAQLELEEAAQVKREKRNKKKQVRQRKKASGGMGGSKAFRRKPMSDDDDESEESATETDVSNASKSASSKSDSSKSNSTSDSDNEPIYKLRKRRQINVSYRLNEFDDMIKSALKEEEDEVAGAGNLGRGKDISTIIEADKEEKLRQQQQRISEENGETVEVVEKPTVPGPAAEDSGSDFEPLKRKPRGGHSLKKKSRKLTTLDISSEGDNDSDEDFKTSSMEDDEEDEEEEEEDSQSDSSLEVYRRRHRNGKGKKKTRRAARRAARERRKDRKFIVEDSEFSDDEEQPRSKKKRKKDSDYTESETNDDDDDEDELSENIDSDDLCDDSTDSEASDGAWRPSKRKKQRSNAVARKSPKLKPKIASKVKKTKRDDASSSFKPTTMKKRMIRDETDDDDSDDSFDSSRKTRGKKCLYLEDFYEDESSDGGIKPGVKRPDTPPEEREQFIKKQEEIKRMLAEKNAEGAKLAATPRLVPLKGGAQKSPAKLDSLSTVPPSVIRQAKVLDIDYLQRKGESISEGDLEESEFDDDDLPDFSPGDMDEEAIARMVEEEDFAQQQLKLPNPAEVLRKKTSREMETVLKPTLPISMPQPTHTTSSASGLQEPIRKKLPMPTIHPPLLRHGYGSPSQHMLHQNRSSGPQHLPLLQNALSAPLNHPGARNFPPTTQAIPATNQGVAAQLQGGGGGGGLDPNKPRGRRKKITPLRDPLEKQQAAAAASAAAAAASKPRIDGIPPAKGDDKSTAGSVPRSTPGAAPIPPNAPTSVTPGVIKSALSIAQPPQLYKPPPAVNTQPSVITRMPHLQGRPMMPIGGPPFPEQGSRFYRPPPPQGQQQPPPPNALIPGSRPPMRHRNQLMPPMTAHHTLRPSYVGGPPPLRPVAGGPPINHSNEIREQGSARQPSTYSGPEQYAPPPARHSAPPHLSPYRPQMYGSPGFPQRGPPTNSSQPSSMRPAGAPPEYASPGSYVSGYGYYPPPPLSVPHSTPPPPVASAVPSSVIVSASSLAASATAPSAPPPPQVAVVASRPPASSPSIIDKPLGAPVTATITPPSVIELSRKPKLTTLETFNTSKVAAATPPPPLTESSESRSPYSSNPPTVAGVDDGPDDNSGSPTTAQQSTSEFSGLVSYFSSQHDDLNT